MLRAYRGTNFPSSFTYKGQAADVKRVGRELGVRYVLGGSVRKFGKRVRITTQLVEAETGVKLPRFRGVVLDLGDYGSVVTASIAAS
jgi:TolB-like protein